MDREREIWLPFPSQENRSFPHCQILNCCWLFGLWHRSDVLASVQETRRVIFSSPASLHPVLSDRSSAFPRLWWGLQSHAKLQEEMEGGPPPSTATKWEAVMVIPERSSYQTIPRLLTWPIFFPACPSIIPIPLSKSSSLTCPQFLWISKDTSFLPGLPSLFPLLSSQNSDPVHCVPVLDFGLPAWSTAQHCCWGLCEITLTRSSKPSLQDSQIRQSMVFIILCYP